MALAARAQEDRPQFGIMLMLLAWFLFAVVDTSAKWLVIAGLPTIQIAFMRYAGHFVVSSGMMARGGFSLSSLRTPHMGLVMLRAFLLVSATSINFFTMQFLALPVISAIMFMSPVFVCLLSMPLLGERVGPWRWFAILLGFVGVIVVIRPFGEVFHWAMLLNLYNAIGLALYSILTRKLAGKVSTDAMQFWMGVLGTGALLPFAIAQWQSPETALDWGLILVIGVIAWAGHQMLTHAHLLATATVLMPFTYSFMIYLTGFSILVFGEVPDAWTIVGALIIMVSGLIIWKREQRPRSP